jgi:hypothetical protein
MEPIKSSDEPRKMENNALQKIEQLGYPLPSAAIQRTKSVQTKKGYDTDGYGYQYCVDRLNEVLGERWGFSWEIIHENNSTAKSGSELFDIVVKMDIWIENPDQLHSSHRPRSCVGSHTSRTYGDALKGAITSAFKKTAAFWGVGRHAYQGVLDDDNDPWPEWAAQNGEPPPAQPASQPVPVVRPVTQQQTTQSPPAAAPPPPPPPPVKNNTPPPLPIPAPAHGNGDAAWTESVRDSGLRRRISAKLDTIFSRSENGIAQFLQPLGGNLAGMGTSQLEKVLAETEKKFEEWKTGK